MSKDEFKREFKMDLNEKEFWILLALVSIKDTAPSPQEIFVKHVLHNIYITSDYVTFLLF